MNTRTSSAIAACAAVLIFTVIDSTFGQGEQPAELKVLHRYIGDWTSDVTSKPAVWTPEAKKFRTSNHAEFVLAGRFLHHIEVSHEIDNPGKVGKALFLWTYDSRTRKHVGWTFHSAGSIAKAHGT